VSGVRREVSGRYVLVSDTRAAFQVDAYDRDEALVIDPVLVYATYLDGSIGCCTARQSADAIAVDTSGDVYVTGWSDAADFPASTGAFDSSPNGGGDIFIT
jgi:poly-beta-hydroxyalkanoate depolymerase